MAAPRARLSGPRQRGRGPRDVTGSMSSETSADQRLAQLVAVHDGVDHAVLEQVFRALEARRQLLADGVLDHARAGEADEGVGLGDMDVAQHGERGRHAAGRRIGQHDDVGQARLLDLAHRDGGAGELHQREDALLHARAARGGEDDQRRLARDGEVGRHHQPLAHRRAHRAAHEAEIEQRHDGHAAAHRAARHDQRVGRALGLGLRLLEPRVVALGVAELQRIGGDAWAADAARICPHRRGAAGASAAGSAYGGRNGCRPPGWPPSRA